MNGSAYLVVLLFVQSSMAVHDDVYMKLGKSSTANHCARLIGCQHIVGSGKTQE